MPMQVYGKRVLAIDCCGRQDDLFHERADNIDGFGAASHVVQRVMQRRDLIAIGCRHIGMNEDRLVLRLIELGFELGFLVLQSPHLVFDLGGRNAFANRIDQLVELAVDFGEACFHAGTGRIVVHAELVQMAGIFFTEDGKELRVHQMVPETIKDRRLDIIALERARVVARSLVARRSAADPVRIEVHHAAAAGTAFHQA